MRSSRGSSRRWRTGGSDSPGAYPPEPAAGSYEDRDLLIRRTRGGEEPGLGGVPFLDDLLADRRSVEEEVIEQEGVAWLELRLAVFELASLHDSRRHAHGCCAVRDVVEDGGVRTDVRSVTDPYRPDDLRARPDDGP